MSVEKPREKALNPNIIGLGIRLDSRGKQVRKDNKQQKKGNIAVRATSAYSRCQPIPWIVQSYAKTPKKQKNWSVCPEVI
ncbi:hypothetical protein CRG98_039445 [Punica granatum]|uniref:Uncharacterized protein n=1 Tax=Punica granatum TaxID=22663 RepID=A0A2I0I852_PUNGR|nr:hypothetical protein CRG98_039445 [Punica granatum]